MRLLASLLALSLAAPALAIDDVHPKKPPKEGAKKEKKDKKKEGRDYEESKYVSLSPDAGKGQFKFDADGEPVLSEKAKKRLEEEAKKKKADAKKRERDAEKAAAKDAGFDEPKAKKPKKKVVKKSLQKKKSFSEAEAAEDEAAGGVDPAMVEQIKKAAGGKLPPMGAPGGYSGGAGDSGGGEGDSGGE